MHIRKVALLIFACFVWANHARAQVITTVAGTTFTFPSQPLPAVNAPLGNVTAIASDAKGNLYVGDLGNHLILRIAPDGTLSVVAGNGTDGYTGDGGPATSAALDDPIGIAVDSSGTIYFAETYAHKIRKISGGIITTVVGGGNGFSGDGGPAANAQLNYPVGVAVDSAGSLYIADSGNNRVRKVSGGIITTVAGTGIAGFSGDNGPAANAQLNSPQGLAVDSAGILYIADRGNIRIRKLSGATITTVAGTGVSGSLGDGGSATRAQLDDPTGLAVDGDGNLFIGDTSNDTVREVSGGVINTIAGNGNDGFSGDLGLATSAMLNVPVGLALDASGNVYIADLNNERIRKVSSGVIVTIAGNGGFMFGGDGGTAITAQLNAPGSVAVDSTGAIYIADTSNNRVRKVVGGKITTVAGTGIAGFSGDGGPAASAQLSNPDTVALDSAGNLYISDNYNGRVRKVSGEGIITTVAGGGGQFPFSGDGALATQANIFIPVGLAFDPAGNLYIADYGNNRIRKVSGGVISTIAGNGTAGFSGDGPAISASLNGPCQIAFDASGNLYVADQSNNRIRKISGTTITTVAGNGTRDYTGDGGSAVAATLNLPCGVAVSPAGDLLIADTYNNVIRKVSGGIITTVAGSGHQGFAGDGGRPEGAAFNLPMELTVDSTGNVFIADQSNNRIREVLNASVTFQASPVRLNFSVSAGGTPPPPQTVTLTSSIPGVGFTAATTAPWLSITPSSGTTPASLQVTVDPTNLTSGTTYSAPITIQVLAATPASTTLPVTAVVGPAIPGSLALGTTSFAFSFQQGAGLGTQQLTISNVGSGSIRYTASASTATGGDWLTVSGTSGSVTPTSRASLTITATPGSLAAGSYSGTVTVTSPDTGQVFAVPITLVISIPAQTILLSQAGFTFTAVAQGGTVLPQSLGILNAGSGELDYNVQATTQGAGSGWLSVSSSSGTVVRPFLDVSFVNINIDASALAPGTYYGQVAVTATGASNSPQTAVVILNVLPPGSTPGPDVRPTGLVFTGAQDAGSPGSQNVTVANLTATPTMFGSSIAYVSGGSIKYQPTNFTVQPNTPAQIVVQPDFTGLGQGAHRAVLTLAFDDGSIQNVSILSVVAPSATTGNQFGREKARDAGGCVPTKLLPQFAQVGFGSGVTLTLPSLLAVKVVDDCGMPRTDGSVVVSFSNTDTPLLLVSLQNGTWTTSWQPSHPVSTVTLSALAQSPAGSLIGTSQSTTGLQQAAQSPPVLLSTLGPFAPGDLMLLKGVGLADGQASSSTAPLPQFLAGTSVTVGGGKAPLLYADAGRLVALVPPDLPVNTSQQVIVARGDALAVAVSAVISATHPAILSSDGSGQGQGLIYTAQPGATTLADALNPVKSGDTILIYCTGLGTVDASGNATNVPQVTLGRQQAQVIYAGLALPANYPSTGAPTALGGIAQVGLGGLYQITATVPGGVPGGAAAILINSAGQASASGVTLMVAASAGRTPPTITSINTAYGSVDIAQNDFIEIHGTNLATAIAGPASLTTQLGGVSVTVNGNPALLYYASPAQINALTPLDSTTGPVQVIVTSNGFPGASFTANLRAVTPAFLRFDVPGHITATHADGSLLGPTSLGASFTPAAPGETIVTYAVGFGLPSTTLVNGSATQNGSLPAVPVCQIGGAPATVPFAGLNGFAGLYQLNLIVPASAANGDSVVSCGYGGQTTTAGTVLNVQR